MGLVPSETSYFRKACNILIPFASEVIELFGRRKKKKKLRRKIKKSVNQLRLSRRHVKNKEKSLHPAAGVARANQKVAL